MSCSSRRLTFRLLLVSWAPASDHFILLLPECLFCVQVLQREKDSAIQQLRACSPERFERLQAENQSLRRASAELEVLRDQVGQYKKAWQEADKRIIEAQVNSCFRQV